MHAQKEDRRGERGYLEKGLKWRGKEQFKVGIRQDRKSLLGKAYGQHVGGACWPRGRSLTAEEARHPRESWAIVWLAQVHGPFRPQEAPFIPHSSKMDREAVKEVECDPGFLFSNMNHKLQPHAHPILLAHC